MAVTLFHKVIIKNSNNTIVNITNKKPKPPKQPVIANNYNIGVTTKSYYSRNVVKSG